MIESDEQSKRVFGLFDRLWHLHRLYSAARPLYRHEASITWAVHTHTHTHIYTYALSCLCSFMSCYVMHAISTNMFPFPQVADLQMRACEFGNWYPVSILICLSLHRFITQWVCLVSRQGKQSIHTVFNKLNRQYAYMGSDVKRIEATTSRCIRLYDPRALDFVRPHRNKK